MHTFAVPVRNELTGEIRIIEIDASCEAEAQIGALRLLFAQYGWRKAVAMRPEWGLAGIEVAV